MKACVIVRYGASATPLLQCVVHAAFPAGKKNPAGCAGCTGYCCCREFGFCLAYGLRWIVIVVTGLFLLLLLVILILLIRYFWLRRLQISYRTALRHRNLFCAQVNKAITVPI